MKGTNRLVALSLSLAFLQFVARPAFAHHGSRVSYDLTKTVTVKGTIKEVQYANPHVYFIFDVKDADGHVTEWGVETDPPIMLENRYGWSKKYLKAGDEVTVTMWQSKVGAPRGFLAKLVTADGKVLDHSEQPQQ
jgi:hypothetical protein